MCWKLLGKNYNQIMVILAIINIFLILLLFFSVNKVQTNINKQILENERYAELYIYPNPTDNTANHLTLIIQNTGSKSLYLQNYKIGNIIDTKTEDLMGSLIPPNNIGFYYISINTNSSFPINFQFNYSDNEGIIYQTNAIGEFKGNKWQIQTEKQIQL